MELKGKISPSVKFKRSLIDVIKSQTFLLGIVIIIVSVIVTIINPNFLTINNLKNILLQISIVAIMTLGSGIVIISGGLDLSIGSMTSLLAVTGAFFIFNKYSVTFAVIMTILTAIAAGFVNGLLIAKTKVVPFIITLGTMSIFSSLAVAICRGKSLLLSDKFSFIGRGSLLTIPMPIYVMAAMYIVITLALKYTKYGRRLYGIGGSEEVAYLAGIHIVGYKIAVYVLNALLVCLASLILISRTGSALATVGLGFELKAIAAAIIGSTALTGGKGTTFGMFLGSLLLGVIQNMLNNLNFSANFQSILIGTIIVIAVAIGKRRNSKF